MKSVNSRFGWKGLDGTGTAPINIVMGDSQKYPNAASAFYGTDGSIDWFFIIKDLNGANSFNNGIETAAHEYIHGVLRYKRGFKNHNPDNCAESRSVEEGIADVFGVYIRNKIKQVPPQNFDWEYHKWEGLNISMADPKGFLFPDTYNGEFYKNDCHLTFQPHPNGGILFKWSYLLSEGFQGFACFHPGQKVYARVKISQAGNNFCRGLNPLCILYQKFGPTHAFWLKDQKAQFWPAASSTSVKAANFVVQIAKDNAFNNIVSSTTVAGNLASTTMLFPPLPDLTDLFVRVLPQNGPVFGICSNVWRIKTNETAALPMMKDPADGTSFPFKDFAAKGFTWKKGTLNMNTVDHFELHLTKTSGPTSIFSTQGKTLNFFIQDPLMFDATGLQASVLAVNSLGAKTGLSLPFNYPICPDHPAVFFPGDLGKVDPTKDFKVEWFPSQSFATGSQFLVTIKENGMIAVPGFTDKPTTANFMLVPAGTLTNGKNYTVTVRNSSSCPALLLPTTFFSAVGSGGSNQPQPPKLVNFNIELNAFRNDLDGLAWETSDYVLGIELIDPDGNLLGLFDPNLMPVTQLLVDSENSGVIMEAKQKPVGKYKLRIKMVNIVNPLDYYPFDQPRFSVLLNGQPVVSNHVITVDFVNPNSPFHEWKVGFQWEIILDIK